MNSINRQRFPKFDPRTKMLLMLFSILSAALAPNLQYEAGLVLLIALFAALCGKMRLGFTGMVCYAGFYFLTMAALFAATGSLQTVFLAFLGLVQKIFPCCFMGHIIVSSTKVSEFMSAMTKLHAPTWLVIPPVIMMRYLPAIREDWRYIKDAMYLRDVSPTLRSLLLKPCMTLECVYVPLIMSASKTADELSIASVTRGIENPGRRTCLTKIRFGMADALVLLCFASYFALGRFL